MAALYRPKRAGLTGDDEVIEVVLADLVERHRGFRRPRRPLTTSGRARILDAPTSTSPQVKAMCSPRRPPFCSRKAKNSRRSCGMCSSNASTCRLVGGMGDHPLSGGEPDATVAGGVGIEPGVVEHLFERPHVVP